MKARILSAGGMQEKNGNNMQLADFLLHVILKL